jgi:hypothetical protein
VGRRGSDAVGGEEVAAVFNARHKRRSGAAVEKKHSTQNGIRGGRRAPGIEG